MQNPKPVREAAWTIIRTLQWTASYLEKQDVDQARVDAEILLAHVLNCSRVDLYMHHDQPMNPEELAAYREIIKRRARREPVAYITGQKEFWSLEFKVSPAALIPRPETECLVETGLEIMKQCADRQLAVLELGTGSGAISVALAKERGSGFFLASDISQDALILARENARRHQVGHLVRFAAGSWFSYINRNTSVFDVIVSNPPYVKTQDMETLAPEIRDYEPEAALDGGDDGITQLSAIIESASDYLSPHGYLLLEMGADQRDAVRKIVERLGCYQYLDFKKDYSGLDRIAVVRK